MIHGSHTCQETYAGTPTWVLQLFYEMQRQHHRLFHNTFAHLDALSEVESTTATYMFWCFNDRHSNKLNVWASWSFSQQLQHLTGLGCVMPLSSIVYRAGQEHSATMHIDYHLRHRCFSQIKTKVRNSHSKAQFWSCVFAVPSIASPASQRQL